MKGPLAHSRARRRGAAPRGVAALEMALILPLLVTIVLGCVDFGRFAYTYITVTNGAREGAAYASIWPIPGGKEGRAQWDAHIHAQVLTEMGSSFNPGEVTVQADDIPEGGVFRRVEVQVSYPFRTIVNWPLLPDELTLRRSVQMRVLD